VNWLSDIHDWPWWGRVPEISGTLHSDDRSVFTAIHANPFQDAEEISSYDIADAIHEMHTKRR
jgi:hypothetical protein